jgi:Flp pilus assembly pilin Flp
VKSIFSNERGAACIESGLWIALVVLVMVGAGMVLASTVGTKYGDIGITVGNVEVPEL